MNSQTTTLILTKNNEDSIIATLESIKKIGPILVADLGSNDKTLSICKEMDVKVYTVPFNYDYSIVRNTLINKVTTEWIFWLDPGEIVSSGFEYFDADKTDLMYKVMILTDDLLIRQTRLFKKGSARFIKPVFESLDPDTSEQTLPIVVTGVSKTNDKDLVDCLISWKDKEPLSPEPNYYLACFYLMKGKYDQFLNTAEYFLFLKKDKVDKSVVLAKYYIASFLKKRNTGKALKLIMECIVACPLMAEFWCLLGDLYLLSIKEYDRAYNFYENAIILGSQRLAEDDMPMEISKYDEYPRKMMDIIRNAIQKTVSQG